MVLCSSWALSQLLYSRDPHHLLCHQLKSSMQMKNVINMLKSGVVRVMSSRCVLVLQILYLSCCAMTYNSKKTIWTGYGYVLFDWQIILDLRLYPKLYYIVIFITNYFLGVQLRLRLKLSTWEASAHELLNNRVEPIKSKDKWEQNKLNIRS